MFENLGQIMIGVFAVIFGIAVIWALILGMKQIGLHFKDYNTYRGNVLSRDEAAEVKEAIEAYRTAKKAEKAAQKV
jgi:hypothetical protein